MLDKGMLHGDCMTVTGKTMAENLASVDPVPVGNPIIMPVEKPLKASGHLQVGEFKDFQKEFFFDKVLNLFLFVTF